MLASKRIFILEKRVVVFLAVFLPLFWQGGVAMAFELKSSAFLEGAAIPRQYTCEGKDISPQLSWKDAPQGTVTFALICDDPDAPVGIWVHWVIYNIPSDVNKLPEGVSTSAKLSDGSQQGINDFGRPGYGGACPPPGRPHRYFFKLYALDTKLDIRGRVTKEVLTNAMDGHILAEANLTGTYKR